jgi:hypothetical protein
VASLELNPEPYDLATCSVKVARSQPELLESSLILSHHTSLVPAKLTECEACQELQQTEEGRGRAGCWPSWARSRSARGRGRITNLLEEGEEEEVERGWCGDMLM